MTLQPDLFSQGPYKSHLRIIQDLCVIFAEANRQVIAGDVSRGQWLLPKLRRECESARKDLLRAGCASAWVDCSETWGNLVCFSYQYEGIDGTVFKGNQTPKPNHDL